MTAVAPRLDWQFELLGLNPSPPKPRLVPPPLPVEPSLLPQPGETPALHRLRALLAPTIASKVQSGAELLRHISTRERTEVIPTALEAIDALLGGGLQRGKLVELVARRTSGRCSVVMSALASATTIGEAAALIDLGDHFDPQIAERIGIDLRRLLWVRPRTVKEAVMSAEMITATGFQLVVVDLGLHPLRGRRAPDAAWVRLARTAEAHGAAMLVSSPYPLTGTASVAVMKGSTTRARWIGKGKAPRLLEGINTGLTLEKHRHSKTGARVELSFFLSEASDQVAGSPILRGTDGGGLLDDSSTRRAVTSLK